MVCDRYRPEPSPGRPLRIGVGAHKSRLVELERVPFGVPEETELTPRSPDDVFVADFRARQTTHCQLEIVDDDLRHDAATSEVLRLGTRIAAGNQGEARPLGRVETYEARRSVEQPEANHVPIEDELALDVFDEDEGAPDLGDVAQGLDRCHRTLLATGVAGRTLSLRGTSPTDGSRDRPPQVRSRRMTGKRSSATASSKPAFVQNSGVAVLVESGRAPTSG